MSAGIAYRLNLADETRIAGHLKACDAEFVPRLSTRVQITDYAMKIVANATRFEAWADDTLIGLVAAYCNDLETHIAHITSVSVCRDWKGKGIAGELMTLCIAHAAASGMKRITLEVGDKNAAAIGLYAKYGFVAAGGETDMMTMSLDLKNGE